MKIKFKNGTIVADDVKKGSSPPLAPSKKQKKKIKKSQVIRILSAMDKDNAGQQQQNQPTTAEQEAAAAEAKRLDELQDEFLNTGRIGRRNAMHDILDEHCETSTAELPLKLSALTTSDSSSTSSSTCPNQTSNNK